MISDDVILDHRYDYIHMYSYTSAYYIRLFIIFDEKLIIILRIVNIIFDFHFSTVLLLPRGMGWFVMRYSTQSGEDFLTVMVCV